MTDADLNLLTALDALLAEGSVAGAARRLGLSASAMSRTLARLRATTGDALLVRAGRDMVLTPRAAELRESVPSLIREARAALQPAGSQLDLATLKRTFAIRANESFVELFSARLVAAITAQAPHVCLHFLPKPDKSVRALREGAIDLEIGVLGDSGPEIHMQALFRDHFIGVVRQGHPLLQGAITPERYAACRHVVVSRHGRSRGPVDEALAALGLSRPVIAVVPGFRAALAIASTSDLVALVTRSFFEAARGEFSARELESFALPVNTGTITVSQMWHPRFQTEAPHRWLRELVREALGK